MNADPKRLLDDAGTPHSLRAALSQAKSEGPADPQLHAMLVGLGSIVDRPVAPPAAPAAGIGVGVKLGVTVFVVALVGGGLVLATRPKPVATVLETAAPAVSLLGESASPPNRSPPTAAAPSTTIDLDDVAVKAAPSAPKPAASTGPSEVALLDQARASLAGNPSRALALTEEHRRRFPKGALSQEREVIAIDALKKLGRSGEAKQRGDTFSAENPDTIHRRTITETKK
jgi:hypothetical protein